MNASPSSNNAAAHAHDNVFVICPRPDSSSSASQQTAHPKVYLAFNEGVALCPYCGALYREDRMK